jgi:hypothetical protein
MANPNNPKGKPSPTRGKQPPVYKAQVKSASLFDNFNKWFDSRSKIIAVILFGCSVLFSLLLFNARMDIGGDDSSYLERAHDFLHKGIFPSFQGPLYPLVISLFMAPFGINILLLKFLSLVFNIVGLYFFYRAFKGRIPSSIFYAIFFVAAINSYILSYASLTYSEAFYEMLQYILLFYLFKFSDSQQKPNGEIIPLKENYKQWLLVGLLVFLLSQARNVGIVGLAAIAVFYLLRKQYKYLLYSIGSFLVYYIPYNLILKVIYGGTDQFGSQGSIFMLKDPYNPADGKESFSGFFTRFFENCNIYLSKRFFQIIGLRSDSNESTELYGGITFIIILLCLLAFYRILKSKNSYMLITFLYVAATLAISFFALQTRWDQPRIIMVCVPMLLMVIFYGFYNLLEKRGWAGQFILVSFFIVVLIAGLRDTFIKAGKNTTIISKNLHGDLLYGYTPDWVNYIKLSKWCADSLPKGSLVLARKSSMSFIYTNGTEFYPIYKQFSTNADTILAFYKKNNVHYFMAAQIRLNPDKNDGSYINTIQQTFAYVEQKYPQKLKFIRQEGTSEAAQLWQILYDK